MSLNYADYGYTLQHLGSVIAASFLFNPDLPISRKSRFGDPVWDWTDEHNARLKVVGDAKVRFDWSTITIGTDACQKAILHSNQKFLAMLPEEMVEDIQRATFIFAMFPSLFATRGKSVKEGRKGITIVSYIKDTVNFFSHLYLQNLLPNSTARIHKLSDITFKDIQKAADNYPYRSDAAKEALRLCANEYVGGYEKIV